MTGSATRKPIRRDHENGKVPEGLSGSEKSLACMERDGQELGTPHGFLREQVENANERRLIDDL